MSAYSGNTCELAQYVMIRSIMETMLRNGPFGPLPTEHSLRLELNSRHPWRKRPQRSDAVWMNPIHSVENATPISSKRGTPSCVKDVALEEEMATPPVERDLAIILDPVIILAIDAIHVMTRPRMQILRVVKDLLNSGRGSTVCVMLSEALPRGLPELRWA